MELNIFDVAHGACALLTSDDGQHFMIDCGHNAETGWMPGTHLKNKGINRIAVLGITNYDEDHVSGLPNLLENIQVDQLSINNSVTPETITKMKSEHGIGPGIKSLIGMMHRYTLPCNPPFFSNINYSKFYNTYPSFTDTNNLSAVFFITINGVNFVFTGDLESDGWEHLLKQPDFSNAIKSTHVFVAPHHGRESGVHPEIFSIHGCKPHYIVISDKRHMHETQQTVAFYSGKTIGGPFRRESKRHVLTTRNDGPITFQFLNGMWHLY